MKKAVRARQIFRWTLISIPLVAIALAAAAYLSLSERYRGFDGETFVKIEHGSGGRAIGRVLAGAGVIRYPWQLWLVRAMSPSTLLQAGEYRLLIDGTKATVEKGKQVVAESEGRWEDRDVKSNYDSVLIGENGEVKEVRFSGQKRVFVLSE